MVRLRDAPFRILQPLTSIAAQPVIAPASPRSVAAGDAALNDSAFQRARRRRARRVSALGFLVTTFVYVWIASAGRFVDWPRYTERYDILGRGFAAGQTNLPLHANVRHLRLPDPYDPVANYSFRRQPYIPDTSLYQGKFYLYWGPVPALLLVPVRLLTGGHVFGDYHLVFAFAVGAMFFSTRLLLRLWTRHFSDLPLWTLFAAVMVAGLATPMPGLMVRGAVYEAAIAGGQLFLLAGIDVAWLTLIHPGRRALRIALASCCFGAAVGCRLSLAPAVAVVVLILLAWLFLDETSKYDGSPRKWLRMRWFVAAALFVPLVATAAGLGWYNYARFGSWLEFGQRYQLAEANYRDVKLFGPANTIPGLYSYFFRPTRLWGTGALVTALPGETTFPRFIHPPANYESFEPVTGVLLVLPFLWLAAVAMVKSIRNRLTRSGGATLHGANARRSRSREAARSGEHNSAGHSVHTGEIDGLIACLLAASVFGFVPVLFLIGSAQRYLVDLTPSLIVVAAVGMWQGLRHVAGQRRARRLMTVFVAAAAATSVAWGLVLALDGTSAHFRTFNPLLLERLSYRTGGV